MMETSLSASQTSLLDKRSSGDGEKNYLIPRSSLGRIPVGLGSMGKRNLALSSYLSFHRENTLALVSEVVADAFSQSQNSTATDIDNSSVLEGARFRISVEVRWPAPTDFSFVFIYSPS